MPQTGYCTDVTCNKELTQLYECHCCNSFICLNHLLEHVETSKRTGERLDKLRNELTSASSTLKTIVDKKLHEIDREKQLIKQVTTMLDRPAYSIDEVQNVYEEINLALLSNRKEETVVKVESSLSDVRLCTCDNGNQPRKMVNSESPLNDAIKDEADDDELNKIESNNPIVLVERCPFIFDDAVIRANVSNSILHRSMNKPELRRNLKSTRERGRFHTRHLFRAAAYGKHSQRTKLFGESQDMFYDYRRVPCPLSAGLIDLFGYYDKSLEKTPCHCKLFISPTLVTHLEKKHAIDHKTAKRIFDDYKQYCTEMVAPLNNSHSY